MRRLFRLDNIFTKKTSTLLKGTISLNGKSWTVEIFQAWIFFLFCYFLQKLIQLGRVSENHIQRDQPKNKSFFNKYSKILFET